MLYQDPKTKIEYAWDTEKNAWKQRGEDSNATPEYDFDGKTYLHTGKQLKFINSENATKFCEIISLLLTGTT